MILCVTPHQFQGGNESYMDSTKYTQYRCAPCGCPNDDLIFDKGGICKPCQMPLVEDTEGYVKHIDEIMVSLLAGKLNSLRLYERFVYPIVVISIFLSIFLLFQTIRSKSSNVFLMGIIFTMSLFAFKNQFYNTDNGYSTFWRSLFTPFSIILAIGPLILIYIRSLLTVSFKWNKKDWLHFLPALLMLMFYTTILFLPESIQSKFKTSPHGTTFSNIEQIGAIISGAIYLGIALKTFKKWSRLYSMYNVKLTFWVKRFFIGMALLLFFWGCMLFLNFWLYDFGMVTIGYYPLWIVFAAILVWVIIEIILNPKFFLIQKGGLYNTKDSTMLTEAQVDKYRNDLLFLMENQKLYTDPDLSLNRLAITMDINSRYLSTILNSILGKSFYEFINYYRIEEAKRLLIDEKSKNFTIEAIGNHVGFKSKSSFNLAFKRQTQLTPSQYLKLSREVL